MNSPMHYVPDDESIEMTSPCGARWDYSPTTVAYDYADITCDECRKVLIGTAIQDLIGLGLTEQQVVDAYNVWKGAN